MSRFYRGIPSRLALFGLLEADHDVVKTPGYGTGEEVRPTGMNGIRRLFQMNKHGEPCPETVTMTNMSFCCTFGGVIIGGLLHGRQAWLNFMQNNQATAFVSHFDAQRQLRDTITLAMGKGAFKWGWKIGAFSTVFIVSSTMIAAYRGGSGFFEYMGAGALTGGLFKMNMGLKGLVAGSVVGATFGSIAGAISVLLLTITGISMEDIQNTQFKFKKLRDENVRAAFAKEAHPESAHLITAAIIEEKIIREASESAKADSTPTSAVEDKK